MRATTILKKDHRVLSGMMATLEVTPRINGMVRQRLFNQIRISFMMHAQIEEEIFYPEIRNLMFGIEVPKVNEAYHHDQIVKDILNQIAAIDPISNEFDSRIAELRQYIDHHVRAEEVEMFPIASRISAVQLEEIGRRMHDRKMNLKTQMAA